MTTLQNNGWEQIKLGRTTLDEVIRYAEGYGDENADEAEVESSSLEAGSTPPFTITPSVEQLD